MTHKIDGPGPQLNINQDAPAKGCFGVHRSTGPGPSQNAEYVGPYVTPAEAARAWHQIDDRLGNPGKDDPISGALHVLAEFIWPSPNGSSGAPS